ncbi:hypothetical protein EJB05_42566 [Eragrostis curvula]|uniref:Uncharacterized protein n=1 Tax=Eragrostis curvula TaxID=38414 RepID=A0A5J9TCS2_9POAL|nr:hypothetical protein EJB05_42566 [Eragrostis curvula]
MGLRPSWRLGGMAVPQPGRTVTIMEIGSGSGSWMLMAATSPCSFVFLVRRVSSQSKVSFRLRDDPIVQVNLPGFLSFDGASILPRVSVQGGCKRRAPDPF